MDEVGVSSWLGLAGLCGLILVVWINVTYWREWSSMTQAERDEDREEMWRW